MDHTGVQASVLNRIQNGLGCQRFRLAVAPKDLVLIEEIDLGNRGALRCFRDGSGRGAVNQLLHFVMSKAKVNDVLCSPHIDVHDLLVIIRVYRDDAGNVEDDGSGAFRDSKETFKGLFICKISLYDLGLVRDELNGGIVFQNKRTHIFAAFYKLAEYSGLKRPGCRDGSTIVPQQ